MARDQEEAKIISLWWRLKVVFIAAAIGFVAGAALNIWKMGPARPLVFEFAAGHFLHWAGIASEARAISTSAGVAVDYYRDASASPERKAFIATLGRSLFLYSSVGSLWAFFGAALFLFRNRAGRRE